MVRAGVGHFVLGLGLALVSPAVLGAQSSCAADRRANWQGPLDRPVSLSESPLPLLQALDRVANATNIHFTYSPDQLRLERRVCARFTGWAVGDVLAMWLQGTRIAAVVVGPDRVVLAPAEAPVAAPAGESQPRPAELAPVVVTGNAVDRPEHGTSYARDVITRADIETLGAVTLQQAISAVAPGLWMWTPMPNGLPSNFGSSRGASSFGLTYPKVYVDGVEVANPLLLSTFGPGTVDRIEVIRGPQGAAMYGSDAISGVINISTRNDPPTFGSPRVELRSAAGLSQSDYAPLGALAQEHAFNVRTGSSARSANFGLAMTRLGAWIPGAFSRQLMASGGAGFVGKSSRLQLTARLFNQQASGGASTLLSLDGDDDTTGMTAGPQSVNQYTLGARAARQGERWLYNVVLGLDGYRLDRVSFRDQARTPSDSALMAASGGADRLTIRMAGTAQFGEGEGVRGALTLGGDQSILRDGTTGAIAQPRAAGQDVPSAWRSTGGLMAHGDLTFGGAFVLSGGVRLERHAGYTALSEVATLPTIGAAWTMNRGLATLTLRGSYGMAIRPPRLSRLESDWAPQLTSVLLLEPEEQSGVEAGADLTVGSLFRFRVTHFDQRARGLIQPVGVIATSGANGNPGRVLSYQLQNVGAIDNRGWEFQSGVTQGRLHVSGAYSVLDSRVDRVATQYSGDLRAGDRVLQVPARTLSLSGSWVDKSWTASLGLARASDWVNYDWLALAGEGAAGNSVATGSDLRAQWRQYDGVTRVRAYLTRVLSSQFGLVVTGENLLGQQLGEPDNVTIVPGRTITAGVRARF